MENGISTYSPVDTSFTFTHPLIGSITADGISQKGMDQIVVRMGVTKMVPYTAMDGATVLTIVPGEYGEIEVQVLQNSTLHREFLALYNAVNAALKAGDPTQWTAGQMFIQNTADGTSHTAFGVGPTKIPDKTNKAQQTSITWVFMAGNIASE